MTVHVSIDGAVLDATQKYIEMDRLTAYRIMLQIGMVLSITDGHISDAPLAPQDDDLLPPREC